MGRIHISEEELRDAWKKYETARKIAKVYKCHYNTILNRSREYGIEMALGPKSRARARSSSVSNFFRTHTGAVPEAYKELADLSHCTESALKNYAYRRRLAAKQVLNQQPWRHTGRSVDWIDIKGARVPDRAFDVVRSYISKWGNIRFVVKMRAGGVHVFKMSAEHLRRLYDIKISWNHRDCNSLGSSGNCYNGAFTK